MLIDFRIKNFLSIKDDTSVTFEANKKIRLLLENKIIEKGLDDENLWLLKSLIFYGGNASGKTNILKWLLALKEISLNSFKYQIWWNTGIKPFLLDADSRGQSTFFEIGFLIQGEKIRYKLELNEDRVLEESLCIIKKKGIDSIFHRVGWEFKMNSELLWSSEIGLNIYPRENQTALSILFDRISAESHLIWNISKFFISLNFCIEKADFTGMTLSKTQNEKHKSLILDFLKNADINIRDIIQDKRLLSKEEVDKLPQNLFLNWIKPVEIREVKTYFSHPIYRNWVVDGEEKFDFSNQESEGTKRLFSLLGPIIDTIENGGVLCIDEIDAHLHFLLLENLIKFLHKNGVNRSAQFLLTTHNLELLDLELFRKDQICFAEKDCYGSTSTFSLDDFKDIQIRSNSDIKKAYKNWLFWGLPILSDFSL